jgi:arylsulfatase A
MRLIALCFLICCPTFVLADSPNVVLILADDLGINDLACYGRTEHRTPNLDRLAREGIRFRSSYAAASICSPTRAALMTGKSPAELHITTFLPGRPDAASQKLLHPKIAANLGNEPVTLPRLLQQAGYATACFGKWHLGAKGHQPTDYGFTSYYPGKANTTPSESEGGKGEYDLTMKAISFIKQNQSKPFFVYLAHNTPHIPYSAKAPLIDKNRQAFEPTYAAVIESMDDTVGQLMKALQEQNLEKNTLVIFTSDNGGLHVPELNHKRITHNKPFRAGKGFLYEGGLRVPLIVRWPNQYKAGQLVDTPVNTVDLFPTIAASSGIKHSSLEGVNLSPLGTGGNLATRSLFWHQPHYTNQGGRPSGAVRHGDWKLIEHYEDGSAELFNLLYDPGETQSLAEKRPEQVKQLRAELQSWRTKVKAQMNEPNPNFEAGKHKRLYVEFDPSRYDPTEPLQHEAALSWRTAMDAAVRK